MIGWGSCFGVATMVWACFADFITVHVSVTYTLHIQADMAISLQLYSGVKWYSWLLRSETIQYSLLTYPDNSDVDFI